MRITTRRVVLAVILLLTSCDSFTSPPNATVSVSVMAPTGGSTAVSAAAMIDVALQAAAKDEAGQAIEDVNLYHWTFGGREIATGINATVALPHGDHTLRLEVNHPRDPSVKGYADVRFSVVSPPATQDTLILKLRVIASQEARARPHFADVQFRVGDKVFPVEGDSAVLIRQKGEEAVPYRLETRPSRTPYFHAAVTQPGNFAGKSFADLSPLDYRVADGPFAGQIGPTRVRENCLPLGVSYAGSDVALYPTWACGGEGKNRLPSVWKPIPLCFDSAISPEDRDKTLSQAIQSTLMSGLAPWFKSCGSDGVGVRVYVDPTDPACRAGVSKVNDGNVVGGVWHCPTAAGIAGLAHHEARHLLGLGHVRYRPSVMCTSCDGSAWRPLPVLEDVIDERVLLESLLLLASSDEKPIFGLPEIYRAQVSTAAN